ncbi:hypothetical protein ACYX34_15175 [Nitrospira sp. CMX1]
MSGTVTRNGNVFAIHTRLGPASMSSVIPYEDRSSNVVVRWEVRLTLSRDNTSLSEDFAVVPDGPFKPLVNYTKLELQRVLEKLAQSPEMEPYLRRFETVYGQVPHTSFLVSQLVD